MIQMNLQNRKTFTDLENKLRLLGMGGIVREFGMDMDTLLYLTWRTSKDLLDSTGNSAQYSVISLWSPGGRMGKGIVKEFRMDMDTLLYLT